VIWNAATAQPEMPAMVWQCQRGEAEIALLRPPDKSRMAAARILRPSRHDALRHLGGCAVEACGLGGIWVTLDVEMTVGRGVDLGGLFEVTLYSAPATTMASYRRPPAGQGVRGPFGC
jgi:hypothetical protein